MFFKKWLDKWRLQDERFAFLFEEEATGEYVAIDTETTGLDPKSDEIISIAAIVIKGHKIITSKSLHIKIKPTKEINEESIKIHKIRHCDLQEAMEPKEAMERLLYFIKNRPLVGYYLEFDVKMINKYLERFFGFSLPNRCIEVSGLYYDFKQKIIPQGFIDLRFDTILEDLDLPKLKAHNAFNDALMSAMIFLKLTKQ